MPIKHFLLALLVVFIWGFNFLFIKWSLEEISPLLLCAIRFLMASIPAIFFIKPPAVSFRTVALYGFFTFALQFSLLFIGMHAGVTPGMASLILQIQIFFSMFFAAAVLGEIPHVWQILGALISFSGIAVVAMHIDNNQSILGFILIIAAAASWGFGNLITRKNNKINMIALVVWGSFIAFFPTMLFSLLMEGPSSVVYTYHHLSWVGITSVAYIVYASTWIGYGVWNWLLGRYSVGVVVPFTLLVPIIGVISSALILGEPLPLWKLIAGALVVAGLCINLFGARLFSKKIKQPEPVLSNE